MKVIDLNNKEITEVNKKLEYAYNRFNNANADMIPACIEEINNLLQELNELYAQLKKELSQVIFY